MQITRLSAAECEDLYRSALPRDFPAAELKPFAEIQRLLESGVYEPLLLTDDAGARFIASGIIDERKDEVLAGLKAAGLEPVEVKEKRGWVCIICEKKEA